MIGVGILILVAIAGAIYGAYLMKRERERQVTETILALEQEIDRPTDDVAGKSFFDRLVARVQRLMPAAMLESIGERLRWTGRPYGLDAGQFVTVKIILALLFPALVPVMTLFQMGSMTVLVMVLGAVVGFLLPDLWLNGRLEERKRLVQEELPLFTDLVATAISAGLSLTEAVRRVAADAPGLVAREFLRAVQEMAAGKQRSQAWRDLMERLPGDELRSIVTAIMQAEQYGTSVSEILRYQVQQIRTFKQQEAQRLAQAATVKMRIPMRVAEVQLAAPGVGAASLFSNRRNVMAADNADHADFEYRRGWDSQNGQETWNVWCTIRVAPKSAFSARSAAKYMSL